MYESVRRRIEAESKDFPDDCAAPTGHLTDIRNLDRKFGGRVVRAHQRGLRSSQLFSWAFSPAWEEGGTRSRTGDVDETHKNFSSPNGVYLRHTASGAAIFRWPDPQLAFIDTTLYEVNILPVLTANCTQRKSTTVAAQWIRIAYHDMSTHDVNDGSGGLDASIVFELDRPQNVGTGMRDSLNDFTSSTSPHVGMADIIAMGAVLGVASCGGPVIPYRGGRIDAQVAGPATVPEPQQDLQSHIDAFKRQGFTQAEMIALVACGHSLGGVRRDDFPQIVDATAPNGFANFDGIPLKFDNAVVTEYLDDTTANPLVKTANVTTRSDLRIFSSDGNATMQSIASPDNFSKTCATLLERMINTVPKDVTLTEPVEPIESKVGGVALIPQNGSYVLRASLRRLSTNPNRVVTMFWEERNGQGSFCPPAGCPVNSTSPSVSGVSSFAALKGVNKFATYIFNAQIPLNTSVSKFWFTVDEKDGSGPQVVDNGGSGFVIDQDTVLFDPSRTSATRTSFSLVIAVRTADATGSNPPIVSIETYQPGGPDFIPTIQTVGVQQDTTHAATDAYTFFTANIFAGITAIHVNSIIGGKIFSQYVGSSDFRVIL
ncbi:putative peroxidase family protein [Lyophyllum shimeji]|uniref:Peroxidase n=1 Tax=Lyophyllum shimeji TaxID=47721 RepID=A0A9P3PSU2_LYOSH|nr:putative peroxidase family protein [Lyophyllum shimeji]